MTELNQNRRRFLKKSAVALGIATTPAILVACSSPSPTSAPAAQPTTAVPGITPTPPPASTPTTRATTASSGTLPADPTRNTTPAPTAIPTTPAAATATASGTAPAGYDSLGAVADIPAAGTPKSFSVAGVDGFVVNNSGTYTVLSAVCTHQGCNVVYNNTAKNLSCPCHGSSFDLTGKVLQPPATAPLATYQSLVVGNTLYAKLK